MNKEEEKDQEQDVPIKKPGCPIKAVRLSQCNHVLTDPEKTRDFPSQSYNWFGFLIIFIFVRKTVVSNFLCRFLKNFHSLKMHLPAMAWQHSEFCGPEEWPMARCSFVRPWECWAGWQEVLSNKDGCDHYLEQAARAYLIGAKP